MGTGISMSSINKIKSLADSGDYSLALDILEHQDLQKSLSPQFIRICGEVYYENGRYVEARQALVKAHSMAPMGNKIVFSIIKLYLTLGLYDLVDKYEEIYKYNQSERDAGGLRIEYLKAKAGRKSVSELLSILISANDIETNEIWDYEMILLYSMQKNREKLKTACEDFLVTYKSSSRKEKVEQMASGDYDAIMEIYCYGSQKSEEDYPEMNEIKEFEEEVLKDDYLRMYPKDPKIMIMVEDNEPVTNSMKFRQMMIKNKDKRETKKLKREQKKEQKNKDQDESKAPFGRGISKRDEEAYEDAIQEIEESGIDTDELLDEITDTDASDMDDSYNDVENNEGYDSDEEFYDDEYSEDTEENADEEEPDIILDEEEAFDMATGDFDIDGEAETDTVIMIDPDEEAFDEDFSDGESFDEDVSEETASDADIPEEEYFDEDVFDEESFDEDVFDEGSSDEEADFDLIRDDEKDRSYIIPDADIVSEVSRDADGISSEFISAAEDEQEDNYKSLDADAYEETSPDATYFEEYRDIKETGEYSEGAEDAEETGEYAESAEDAEETGEYAESAEYAESSESADGTENMHFDTAWTEPDEYENENSYDEIESSVEIEPDYDFEPEMDFEAEAEPEPEYFEEAEAEPEPEYFEEVEAEPEPEPEAYDKTRKKTDFPVFKTSLFPDYNSTEEPVYKEKIIHKGIDEKHEEEIKKNLHKEEELLHETDLLLARLGIELGTDLLGSGKSALKNTSEDTRYGQKNTSGDEDDEDSEYSFKLK